LEPNASGRRRRLRSVIETGKHDPSLPLAFKMARLFGLRTEEIFSPDAAPDASE